MCTTSSTTSSSRQLGEQGRDSAPFAETFVTVQCSQTCASQCAPTTRRGSSRSAPTSASPLRLPPREGDLCQDESVYKPGFYLRVPRAFASASRVLRNKAANRRQEFASASQQSSQSEARVKVLCCACVLAFCWLAVASVLLLFPTAQYTRSWSTLLHLH